MSIDRWREDSELGEWTQLDWRPSELRGLVESISLFDGKLTRRRQRYYPSGELDLIVHLDGPSEPFRIVEGQPAAALPLATLAGQIVAPVVLEAPDSATRILDIRLRPAGAFAMFGMPLHELTGATVDLGEVIGSDARRLVERLDALGSDEARVQHVGRWITERVARHPGPDPSIAYAVSEIERAGGREPIANILGRMGTSPNRFSSQFREQVGVKPKLFARIVRFRGLVEALRAGHEPFSQRALAHGYYDQPHMNAEFRQFAGMSPGQFMAAIPIPESLSLAD